jgi:hypothetical protein
VRHRSLQADFPATVKQQAVFRSMSNSEGSSQDVFLDVYGCQFLLTGTAASSLENLANDFQFFATAQTDDPITVEINIDDPPYDKVPDANATTYTPRNVAFTVDNTTYLDYGGRALGIWNRHGKRFQITTRDPDIQYEAAYLFLLSRIGECLDNAQLHRIHAMAVSVNDRAVVAILPMGGGKSTLCSALLKFPEFSLLSDDSPFIGQDGQVHAFPLRLGLLPGNETDIPAEYRRTINRMEFGPKILVTYEYFADRIKADAAPGIVFMGQRCMSADCRIEPAGKWAQYKSILLNCVVGLGLYQGLEFVLTHSPVELLSKTRVAWSRFRIARKLFSRSTVYELTLGRDQELNAATVRAFVADKFGTDHKE